MMGNTKNFDVRQEGVFNYRHQGRTARYSTIKR